MDNIGKLLESYMFSNLAQIVSARPRHAENSDARLDIRRHDPDQQRKQNENEGDENKAKFDTYDNAVVSVNALRVFLENFLASLTPEKNTNANIETNLPAQNFSSSESPAENEHRPVSAQATHAANVYKAGAKTAPRPAPTKVPEASNQNPLLMGEDVRTIHGLLRDIAILQARGIEFLTIEKNETFLASLAAAVTKALNP